jgi:hypothetical protein
MVKTGVWFLGLSLWLLPAVRAAEDPIGWFQTTTQRLYDAVTAGDPKVWDAVLDNDCIVTDEDGTVFNRTQFLATVKPLPAHFSGDIRVRGLTLRSLGTAAATVHYWLDETEEIFGQHLRTTYVETDTYRRAGAEWKAVAMQVTVVPRDLEPVDVDRSQWSQLLGEYAYDPAATSRYHVFRRDGKLFAGRDEKSATELIPLAPLVFHQQGSIHLMVFVRDRAGAVNEVRELHKYNEIRMLRSAPAPN